VEEVEVVKKSTVQPKKTSKPKKIDTPMIDVDDEAVEKVVKFVKKNDSKTKEKVKAEEDYQTYD